MKPNDINIAQTRQPIGLYVLSFSELWDRFSYYGLQAVLVLYLIKVFLLSDNQAYTLFGAYTGLTFVTPIIGGLLADRFLGFYRASIIGAVLIILGNIILAVSKPEFLYIGLASCICGVGLFKPNNASLVGALYQENDLRRGSGFTLFYIAMNAGALSGPAVYGYTVARYGWHSGFAISAVSMLIALTLLIIKSHFLVTQTISVKYLTSKFKLSINQIIYIGLIIAIMLFGLLLKNSILFNSLLAVTGILTIAGLCIISIRSLPQDRNRIIGLAILSFFCIFYFACSLQLATSLTLFIERDVTRSLFGWQIPTAMFLSLQPFFIIITAPILAKLWLWLAARNLAPSTPLKIALGLIFSGISFVIFAMGAYGVNISEKIPLLSVIMGDWILGIAELCLVPVMLTAISQLAPPRLQGTFMGVYFLAEAFSSYLASFIAKFINTVSSHSINISPVSNYAHGFLQLSYLIMGIGIFVVLLTPWFKKLLNESVVTLDKKIPVQIPDHPL